MNVGANVNVNANVEATSYQYVTIAMMERIEHIRFTVRAAEIVHTPTDSNYWS
jgi:hypothetical protein